MFKFKRDNDSYLYDELCTCGYNYDLYPRNILASKDYTYQGYSSLYYRVHALQSFLPENFYTRATNNFYISAE